VTLADIDFRRPGTGIQPDALHLVEGRTLCRDVPGGQMLALEDFLR
jgi:hypothetical protein